LLIGRAPPFVPMLQLGSRFVCNRHLDSLTIHLPRALGQIAGG
jgi:hypothetical protein